MRKGRCNRSWALLLLLALLCISNIASSVGATTESSSDDENDDGFTNDKGIKISFGSNSNSKNNKASLDTGVVVLTSTNFGKNIGDGSVWLVEFYAPWCTHCMNFAPTYTEIARHFHTDPKSNVRVGKVDTTVEKALGQRFNVNAFPSFFVIRGSQVYEFEGSRSKNNLIRYATSGYKEERPIPFYSSPMGPLGRLQGFLIWAGVSLMSLFKTIQNFSGLSPLLVGCLLCAFVVLGGMITMIVLVVALTPREKVD